MKVVGEFRFPKSFRVQIKNVEASAKLQVNALDAGYKWFGQDRELKHLSAYGLAFYEDKEIYYCENPESLTQSTTKISYDEAMDYFSEIAVDEILEPTENKVEIMNKFKVRTTSNGDWALLQKSAFEAGYKWNGSNEASGQRSIDVTDPYGLEFNADNHSIVYYITN